MPNTSGGSPYPVLSDENNPPADLFKLALQLDKSGAPKFANATARNTAFPSPTLGQLVVVAGELQIFDGTTWQVIRPNEIVKHGIVNNNATGAVTVTFPTPFPTFCSQVMVCLASNDAKVIPGRINVTRTGFTMIFARGEASGLVPTIGSAAFTAWGY